MSSEVSFWKRVGSAFRAGGPLMACENSEVSPLAVAPAGDRPGGGNGWRSGGFRLPWVGRRQSLRQLDERYRQMLELADAIRDHFERQDERARELTAGVERLGCTLEQLAEAQRAESRCIASIAARMDEASRHTAGLSATLLELPAALQAQAEAVHAVARQMEASRASDLELVGSLQQFSRAADALRDSGAAQIDTLRGLHQAGEAQHECVAAFVRQQTRLLLIIALVVTVVGLGALCALAIVVRMIFQ